MANSIDSELQVVTIAAGYPSYDVNIPQVVVQLRLQAGLIVMGNRALGGVKRALMVSVSASVVRHAHCPVLAVRPEDE